MEGVEISIPPVKEYRTHLTLVTRYCSAAILLTKVEDIKSLGYEQLIDEKKLISLAERLRQQTLKQR